MKYKVVIEVTSTVVVEVEASNHHDAEEKGDQEFFYMDFGPLDVVDHETRQVKRLGVKEGEIDKLELVKCMDCGWIGTVDELVSDGAHSDPCCSTCWGSQHIIPFDIKTPLQPHDVEQLWDIFCSMVELNLWCETMYDFYIFPAGTHRSKIHEWFDSHYEGGLLALDI